MTKDIQIIEKPEWVSWDEIHEVLWAAHKQNRKKGIFMALPSLSGKEIQSKIEGNGVIFLAVDGRKPIGTLAIIKRNIGRWFHHGEVGYLCFGAVLQEYSGQGIYRRLYQVAETFAAQEGLSVLTRDTNERNARMLKITQQEGYHFVSYRACKDHYNIVRAKWLDKCPFPLWYIKTRFFISKIITKCRYRIPSTVKK